jgi:hypothetical protein
VAAGRGLSTHLRAAASRSSSRTCRYGRRNTATPSDSEPRRGSWGWPTRAHARACSVAVAVHVPTSSTARANSAYLLPLCHGTFGHLLDGLRQAGHGCHVADRAIDNVGDALLHVQLVIGRYHVPGRVRTRGGGDGSLICLLVPTRATRISATRQQSLDRSSSQQGAGAVARHFIVAHRSQYPRSGRSEAENLCTFSGRFRRWSSRRACISFEMFSMNLRTTTPLRAVRACAGMGTPSFRRLNGLLGGRSRTFRRRVPVNGSAAWEGGRGVKRPVPHRGGARGC